MCRRRQSLVRRLNANFFIVFAVFIAEEGALRWHFTAAVVLQS